MTPSEPCPPCADGDHATVEDGVCTCCGATLQDDTPPFTGDERGRVEIGYYSDDNPDDDPDPLTGV